MSNLLKGHNGRKGEKQEVPQTYLQANLMDTIPQFRYPQFSHPEVTLVYVKLTKTSQYTHKHPGTLVLFCWIAFLFS